MSSSKVGQFINNNIVLIVGIPLIGGVFWGWLQIQKNPALVDPSQRKEFPVFAVARRYRQMLLGGETEQEQLAKDDGK